ncbi:MAG: glycosyltransferase family 2 protein [Lentimicrobiaceae bacterium]|nr:glycosyltransferase family 2 protein [Lentimicrobiaceae bacterium]
MLVLKITFWILAFIVFYSYLGYGMLLFVLVKLKKIISTNTNNKYDDSYEPEVTLFVAAYNEKDYVARKVQNIYELNYPKEKVKQIWVTDGSNDGTPELLAQYPNIKVYHQPERAGKIAAMNRGISFVDTPIVIFSDGNTLLGKDSVREIVRLFSNPKTGCVSGEKRIFSNTKDTAATAGEGIYWKYESKLKKWDAELYSAVGAAGELFAIRTNLYTKVEHDTLLDDFIISMRIAKQGYVIQYNPNAYAIESSSANVKEEMKRKIRISAGGIQSTLRLKELMNPFRYGLLAFQFVSHRVLRWTIAAFSLPILFLLNFIFAVWEGFFSLHLYSVLLYLQLLFYALALCGWYLENHKIKIKILFIPYYFFIMNLCVFLGLDRYIKGKQSVNWEKAKRAD